jgi:hypothetical protein
MTKGGDVAYFKLLVRNSQEGTEETQESVDSFSHVVASSRTLTTIHTHEQEFTN